MTAESTSAVTINKSFEATPQYLERSKNTEYLMVCLLAASRDNEVLKFLPSDQVSPIVIQLTNFAPNGAFETRILLDIRFQMDPKYEEQTPQYLSHPLKKLVSHR